LRDCVACFGEAVVMNGVISIVTRARDKSVIVHEHFLGRMRNYQQQDGMMWEIAVPRGAVV